LQAGEHGIGMVFQDQSLILNLTVAQNIFLGREKPYKRAGLIDWKRMNQDAQVAIDRLGISTMVSPGKVVNNLNFATRQMVEIAKVLDIISTSPAENHVLLLDEPTTVLSDEEIRLLFEQVRKLKEEGVAVVFISHRLDEVMEITDRIVVMRDGKIIDTFDTETADTFILYERMVGRATSGEYYYTHMQTKPADEVVLEVKDLCQFGSFKNVSFKLRRGEVLGLCGVEGSGKEEVCAAICGDLEYTYGTVSILGRRFKQIASPAVARRNSLLAIPKERREEGMAGMLSVSENIALSSLRNLSKKGVISNKKADELADRWVSKMGVKCDNIHQRIDRLSGGNAQKVIFARLMNSGCDILILNHPTRGVDVGAKSDIYRTIREITDSGKSVILLGDTLDECIGLSSRIIVLKDGEIAKEIECDTGNRPTQLEIVRYMM
jgi:ribose transport system ATP-binding protein